MDLRFLLRASSSASRLLRLSGQSGYCASAAHWQKGAYLAWSLAWERLPLMQSTAAWLDSASFSS